MATPSEEILSNVSISRLAERLGTDEGTAREAAEAALPTLLAGMTQQARDPQRRQGLANALQSDHDPAVLDDEDPFNRVDPEDGRKILGHVFGEDTGRVESELQGFLGGGGGGGLMSKMLPMLAPLVMSYLSKKMRGGGAAPAQRSGGGGGLGDILGSVLGGAQPGTGSGGPGAGGQSSDIGDILGSVFGGGSAGRSDAPAAGKGGGGLGDILGQLGGKAGGGGGLDDLLGSILGGRR